MAQKKQVPEVTTWKMPECGEFQVWSEEEGDGERWRVGRRGSEYETIRANDHAMHELIALCAAFDVSQLVEYDPNWREDTEEEAADANSS